MKNISNLLLALIVFATTNVSAQTISVLFTTDVHGAIFPYEFTRESANDHSLAQAYTFIQSVRDTSDNVILLDNGDFLQGTPAVYYYNNVDNKTTNLCAKIYNYMKVDAVSVGNHDIETGHEVYDKVKNELEMPWLSANIINKKTGEPYFTPYTIVTRAGKKIAIIGLTTPYIPHWIPEYKWEGMDFEDMVESARKWVNIVKEKENPDAIIGLFHSGYDYNYGNMNANTYMNENASVLVAERVNGFNAILVGHDHKLYNRTYNSPDGSNVTVIDAGTAARNIGLVNITFDSKGEVRCESKLVPLTNLKPSADFTTTFQPQFLAIKAYTQKVIGRVETTINSRDALFGNSTFVDMIHTSMLKRTGADISFSAPLLLGVKIEKGDITVGRMFDIYKFENMLNVISLSGAEVKRYLEYSYNLWISNPDSTKHIIAMRPRGRLTNKHYNFDSAAGINYTVNPYKPYGERIEITSMADGSKFDMNKQYKVALNSYRYNGGGGHLEFGLGFSKQQIEERLIESVRRDLRGIVMDDIISVGKIIDHPLNNWKFVPEKKLEKYIEEDKKLF